MPAPRTGSRPPAGRSIEHVVVVGAGLAGAKTCHQLRLQGYAGRITLVGAEPQAPYDRPPLTKAVLLGQRNDTTLRVDFGALGVEALFGTSATGLDVEARVLHTSFGAVPYDALVIATGASPLRFPEAVDQYVVRTQVDALVLRKALSQGEHVAVIGASWIGAEVATAALALGCRVTCVEASTTVSHNALGDVGRFLEPWWHEVDLILNTLVDRVERGKLELADGQTIESDAVVVGIGVYPNVEWLRDSGLAIDGGIVVDEWLRAHESVVAVGDVAAWWSRRYARRLRVEHWDNAVSGAAVAAASVLSHGSEEGPVYDPVPYFWSDQFGHKLQYLGAHDGHARHVVRQASDGELHSVVWLDEHEGVTAILLVDSPREMRAARELVESRAQLDIDRLLDPDVPFGEFH